MARLSDSISALEADRGRYSIDAPEAWAQGRTLYGGMTLALAHEAAIRHFDSLPPLRSAQCVFVGPAQGRLHFLPGMLRQGRSTTMVAVEAVGDDGPLLRASFLFAAERESGVRVDAPPLPAVIAPDDSGPLFPGEGSRAPGFTANFDMRLGAGSQGGSGGDPMMAVWTRYRDQPDCHPVTALLALADAPPPAAIVRFPRMGPLSSVTWNLDLLDTGADPGGWFLARAEADRAVGGLTTQDMRLWSEDGRCAAIGRQQVALFV